MAPATDDFVPNASNVAEKTGTLPTKELLPKADPVTHEDDAMHRGTTPNTMLGDVSFRLPDTTAYPALIDQTMPSGVLTMSATESCVLPQPSTASDPVSPTYKQACQDIP